MEMEMEAAAAAVDEVGRCDPDPDSAAPKCPRPVRGVRVVGRICPDSDLTAAAATRGEGEGGGGGFQLQVAVQRPVAVAASASASASAVVSFINRSVGTSTATAAAPAATGAGKQDSSCYNLPLDWCYLKDEGNHVIFRDEVKPLIEALFSHHPHAGQGSNSLCVVACAAPAPTAKTRLIMGSQHEPGLAAMAMSRVLELSKGVSAALVSISSYQVLQDNHIFDLLEPKGHEVLILDDAHGTTHLKGLSKVHVKSIDEFARLSCCSSNQHKHPTKASSQLHATAHQGLIIYVSRLDHQGRECPVAKINFLDLAGYVDAKHNSNGGGLAPPNSNKSMYALMNVVHALNSNQSFVPYRQSKVTRILQDSLCKTSGAVLIACLDEFSCQDAISALSLASRSSQVVNEQCYSLSMSSRSSSRPNVNLSMNAKNLSRPFLSSIHQPNAVLEKRGRPQFNNNAVKASQTPTANKRSQPITHSAKTRGTPISSSIKMEQKDAKPTMSGRKLFCPSSNSSKEVATIVASTVVTQAEEIQPSLGMDIEALSTDEGRDGTGNAVDAVSSEMQEVVPCSMQEMVSTSMQEENYSASDLHALGGVCSPNKPDNIVEKTPVSTTQPSPKLSDRLREISNSLKLLSTRPVSLTAQKLDMECARQISMDAPEPKTPGVHLKFEGAEDPQDILKARSTGIKKSLVQECLSFLNSANKEQLKSLKGIGEKRANYILQLREESPEPFKEFDDLRDIIGLNSKEIKKMMLGVINDS